MVASPIKRHTPSLRHLQLLPQQPAVKSHTYNNNVIAARSEADWAISDRGWLGWDQNTRQWIHENDWTATTGRPLPEHRTLDRPAISAFQQPVISVRQQPIAQSISDLLAEWQQLTADMDRLLDAIQDRACALDDNAHDHSDPFPLIQARSWAKQLSLGPIDKRLLSINNCLESSTNPPIADQQREGAFTPHMSNRENI